MYPKQNDAAPTSESKVEQVNPDSAWIYKGSRVASKNFAKVANARKIGKTFCHKRNRADITDFSKKKSRIFNHA